MVASHAGDKVAHAHKAEGASERYFLIGEAADRTGLTQRTIRYYEELGLLSPPSRTQGDFRLFSEGDLDRLKEIGRLKHLLGFSLAEIRKIVEGEEVLGQLRSEYRATDDTARRLALLENATRLTDSQLVLIEAKMSQLEELRTELVARQLRYAEKHRELEQALTTAPHQTETTT